MRQTFRDTGVVHYLNFLFIAVVLFIHHNNYIEKYDVLTIYTAEKILRNFAVGGFLFLSGLKLALSNHDKPVSRFVSKRLFRIYPLYWLALLLSSLTAYPYANEGRVPNLPNTLVHVLGLQSVFPHYFQVDHLTLWFVSVVTVCYCFFLLTRHLLDRQVVFSLVTIGTVFSIYGAHIGAMQCGMRIFTPGLAVFLAIFAMGMLLRDFDLDGVRLPVMAGLVVLAMIMVSIVSFRFSISGFGGFVLSLLLTVGGNVIFFVALCVMVKRFLPGSGKPIVVAVSGCGYCIFLFHRSIFAFLARFIEGWPIWGQWIVIVPVGLVMVYVFSSFIQTGYNKLLTMVKEERT